MRSRGAYTSRQLRRASRGLPPRRVIIIVCEGARTEPSYFEGLRQRRRLRTAQVRVFPGRTSGNEPSTLIGFARKLQVEFPTAEVFCVFDYDGRPQIMELLDQCRAKPELRPVLSNPCVELWFLLHYEYFAREETQQDLKRRLRAHIPRYEKLGTSLYDLLESHQARALPRARRLRENHEALGRLPQANPSTSVDILVEVLYSLPIG